MTTLALEQVQVQVQVQVPVPGLGLGKELGPVLGLQRAFDEPWRVLPSVCKQSHVGNIHTG